MHKALLILSLLAISGFATSTYYQELAPLWGSWKIIQNKEYSTAEEEARFAIFIDNYKKIVKFNAEHTSPRLRLGKFADLTSEEFKNTYSGCVIPPKDKKAHAPQNSLRRGRVQAPESIDWREKNVLNPVKNQDSCGSCWAFASVGALEAFHAIKTGELLTFAEQELVDCDTGSFGCEGGWPASAIDYSAQNGMASEDDYPYTHEKHDCQYQGGGTQVNSGHTEVPTNSVDDLKASIATAPTTVLVEVNDEVYQHYDGGIIGPDQKCGTTLNHAVLAVGYGDIDGKGEAFILRNSWGDWGDHGYFYISTDAKANDGAGVCGILGNIIGVE